MVCKKMDEFDMNMTTADAMHLTTQPEHEHTSAPPLHPPNLTKDGTTTTTTTTTTTSPTANTCTHTLFPLSRIKKLIKQDDDVKNVTQEAVFMVAKATEFFLQQFCWTVYENAHAERRKTVQYRDLVHAVETIDEYFFLEDILPVAPKYVSNTTP